MNTRQHVVLVAPEPFPDAVRFERREGRRRKETCMVQIENPTEVVTHVNQVPVAAAGVHVHGVGPGVVANCTPESTRRCITSAGTDVLSVSVTWRTSLRSTPPKIWTST